MTPQRCPWAGSDGAMLEYHDTEWGVPVRSDRMLFELLILEGAQAGLSWRTVLHRREGYRRAFGGFDPVQVASIDSAGQAALLADPGIIRNRAKISATVGNAVAWLRLLDAHGSFAAYLWERVDGIPIVNHWTMAVEVPTETALSRALSKDLRHRGFRFVGPMITYAYLQATGVVMDHLESCFRHAQLDPTAPPTLASRSATTASG